MFFSEIIPGERERERERCTDETLKIIIAYIPSHKSTHQANKLNQTKKYFFLKQNTKCVIHSSTADESQW